MNRSFSEKKVLRYKFKIKFLWLYSKVMYIIIIHYYLFVDWLYELCLDNLNKN